MNATLAEALSPRPATRGATDTRQAPYHANRDRKPIDPQHLLSVCTRITRCRPACRRDLSIRTDQHQFAIVELFQACSVSRMNNHGARQEIAHVLHQFELTEFVQR